MSKQTGSKPEAEAKQTRSKSQAPQEMECVIVGADGPSRAITYEDYVFQKSEVSEQIGDNANSLTWKPIPNDMSLMEGLVYNSSILPQCIHAYSSNVAGFGIGVRPKDGADDSDPAVQAELQTCRDVIDSLSDDEDTKKVFEDVIELRETYGVSYLEVTRNGDGQVAQLYPVSDPKSVERSIKDDDETGYVIYRSGMPFEAKKRFFRYRQQKAGKTVYFKEFGDPRIMNKRTGEYDDETDLKDQANELIAFRIGRKTYGMVRWGGTALSINGAYMAERLNNNYFKNGRHTPLMVIFENGMLTPESERNFKAYMNGVKGEEGQFKFLLLFAKNAQSNSYNETDPVRPSVQVKDLASILQKDELFGEYIDSMRRKVQSAMGLPDLYVGYTTDFNRATAQTAMKVTEQQIFQPMRKDLAWVLNNKILGGYGFQNVEAYFNEPDVSNPEDLYKVLSVANNAGGVTPNKARDIIATQMGEVEKPFDEPWGDIPLAIYQMQQSQASFPSLSAEQAEPESFVKSAEISNEEIAALLKGVADIVRERTEDS